MTRTCFISDTHLDQSTPDLNALFVDTLSTHIRGAKTLYLLGDIFEVWIGDDYQPDWLNPIFEAIKHLASSGTAVYFMVGNRDFLLGSTSLTTMGATHADENTTVDIGNHSLLLCHGDALCTDDVPYQNFRSMVRNPEWQKNLLSQPVETRMTLAKNLRLSSKADTANKTDAIMDVNQQEAERVLLKHDRHIMIHGHTHRPGIHTFTINNQAHLRIVLGDWRPDQPSWITLDDTGNGELIAHSSSHRFTLSL